MSVETKPVSQTRLALRRLRRHKVAVIGGVLLVVLYLSALFADFLAPYHYDNESRQNSYNPPTRLHFFDESGRFHAVPFVYNYSYQFDEFFRRRYVEDTSKMFPVRILVRGDEHYMLGLFRTRIHLFGTGEGSRLYLLGADSRGRDLFSRILYGGRVSLSVGLVGVSLSFTLGMIVGGLSGYFGGKIDNVLMRLCEMVMMIPGFYLMLALRAAFPLEMSSVQAYFMIIFILSFIGWAGMSRVIRGMTLSLREREFITAAQASGQRTLIIVIRHLLPHTMSYAIISATLSIPGYILGESALSLLGLGIQDPYASWGNLLSDAMNISEIKFHPWILLPGVFIFVAVMAFNFLGDGLRDAFDPKMVLEEQA